MGVLARDSGLEEMLLKNHSRPAWERCGREAWVLKLHPGFTLPEAELPPGFSFLEVKTTGQLHGSQ